MKFTNLWAPALLFAAIFAPRQPSASAAEPGVLIIMDERPAMENLAAYLKKKAAVESVIVDQKSLPAEFSRFKAVIIYVHRQITEPTELKIIAYAKDGGRLVCLHHSISSTKAANKHYFDFLGVRLDGLGESREPTEPGGHYAWREPVELSLVNLCPDHYIVRHDVQWPERVRYASSDQPSVERTYPAMVMKGTEVYLNHKFTDGREKLVLAGIKYFDDRNGRLCMQDRAIWIKPVERGTVVYFSPGHTAAEFEDANFAQMILNAVLWRAGDQ